MSQATDRIDSVLHNHDGQTRVTVFVRKEQLDGRGLDIILQDYVRQGWLIMVRRVQDKNHPGVFGLTFCKNSKHFYGDTNPYFVS